MSQAPDRATTLVEVLVAVVLFSMIMFGVYNMQLFSDNQVVLASRKSVLQRECAYVLEHMSKQMLHAVSGASFPVDFDPAGNKIRIWIDSNGDGRLQTNTDPSGVVDSLIYYRHDAAGNITFCANATTALFPATSSCNVAEELLGTHMLSDINTTNFAFTNANNYVEVNMTACWKPGTPGNCGSLKNPKSEFRNRIPLPAVSAS
jgi:type II secretory pathway pseudopilin PulG